MEYRHWNKKDGTGRSISTSLLGYGCMRFPTLPDGSIDEVRAEKLLKQLPPELTERVENKEKSQER